MHERLDTYTKNTFLSTPKVKRTNNVTDAQLDACPGYDAVNIKMNEWSLEADLKIRDGNGCGVYGPDLKELKLKVTYETESRIHLQIHDPSNTRYTVPTSVLPRPPSHNFPSSKASIQFKYTTAPFTFSIVRSEAGGGNEEVLFGTSQEHPLIFEEQYLRLKTTALPADANIYGLGEHTETFRLPNQNFTRTLWARDAYSVPAGTNLYGAHPIYFEHRFSTRHSHATHGVFLLNSNGMDIKIDQDLAINRTSLEYNVIGGIFDFYFLAGPEPRDVARQYSEVVGRPAEVAYWTFGLHQCRYGYTDYVDVMEVVQNYSRAGIPLETMWTDIDYMYERRTFTVDPQYFPLKKMQEFVRALHSRNQHYVMMVDPAVAYQPNVSYETFDRGAQLDVFLLQPNGNGSFYYGVVWPGVVVYPDWFHPSALTYWIGEFERFFDKEKGIDIDGVWIDMNEPSNFCGYPCVDPFGLAAELGLPPKRDTPPPPSDVPIILSRRWSVGAGTSSGRYTGLEPRAVGVQTKNNESEWDLLEPPYSIQTASDGLSDRTAYTNIVHYDGTTEYDAHNVYGTMMSVKTHEAMLARRPGLRTLVITRSTFAGAGAKVGKWLGDNISTWHHYQNSIAGMLGFASIYQVPMVGADICGFGGNTTEILCARWAMLGAFGPFYRNHNAIEEIPQEFYRWPLVTQAAKNAIDMRYRLLDYIYTAFHRASVDGSPVLNPMFFNYPSDPNTFRIDSQFFFGDSVLVSPVIVENATDVTIYLPGNSPFYDFLTYTPLIGNAGSMIHLTNVSYTSIPVHIKGGTILPLRLSSANTTSEVRTKDFELVVAPSSLRFRHGKATGSLYIDDGVSIKQTRTTELFFSYKKGELVGKGKALTPHGTKVVKVALISFLGIDKAPRDVRVNGRKVHSEDVTYDQVNKVVRVKVSIPLGHFTVNLH
ncbi:alpha-glucosidase [Cantharellus anzutake]|uniref:alpha-glucosidase n=1 Tax=Cantharellus anzutake TaxID=1750568 RepID=UPI00190711AB|nr:alpha-glucosidase [Cantharellus anzutake]KAF8329517.1 alpha-glucosidase [Cantharellus anzutake]